MKLMYYGIIAFVFICPIVCFGEEACEELLVKTGSEKKVSYVNDVELARAKMVEGDYADALVDIRAVIALNEDILFRLYHMRGECHFRKNEFAEAEADYRKALLLCDSVNGVAEYMVGKCLFEQKKYQEAHTFFQQALKRFPESTVENDPILKHARFQYKYDLALALFEMGRQEEAIQMFHEIQREFPDENMNAIMEYIEKYRENTPSPASAFSTP